jgi:peroxiredoxin
VAVADVGTVAPDFQLEDADGRTVTLSAYRGQAVVLFFSSVRCPRTAEYQPRIDKLAREYVEDARVKFLAVDVTRGVGQSIDRGMIAHDAGLRERCFPTLLDDKGYVAGRYSAVETPTVIVIDDRGLVRYRGPFDDNRDLAFASRNFCAEALRNVLGAPTSAVAGFLRP